MDTIHPGLVSISFRSLSVEQIVSLVGRAGQRAVEWGGDVHVPHGDLAAARRASRLCRDAGIATPSYGSYFRVGKSADEGLSFERVVETAGEIGVSTIRVWAGATGSAETEEAVRQRIVQETQACADLCTAAGMTISFEYHGGTLTDTDESALRFLKEVDHPAVRSYWQPRTGVSVGENLQGLTAIAPWLSNVHVFHWNASRERMVLSDGAADWESYLSRVAEESGDRYAMLEFVRDDNPEQYLSDAGTLDNLLARLNG